MKTISALTALVLLVLTPHAWAQEATSGVDPTQEPIGSGTIVNGWALAPSNARPNLSYSVDRGQEIQDSVTLFNYSNVQLTFRLYATDAFNNVEGSFDLLPADEKPTDVGSWVQLPQENLSLPAKSQATFPITIRIPQNAKPGDHAGAILASNAAVGRSPDGKVVNVDRRTGSRVYVRVAGKLRPELVVTKVGSSYRPSLNPFSSRNEVTYRIENHGNVRLSGKHRSSASGLLGLGAKRSKYKDIPELLPGQGVTLTQSFSGLPATVLNFAKVEVDPDDVDGERLATVSRTAATTALPFTLFAAAVIAGLLQLARRSYARHGAA